MLKGFYVEFDNGSRRWSESPMRWSSTPVWTCLLAPSSLVRSSTCFSPQLLMRFLEAQRWAASRQSSLIARLQPSVYALFQERRSVPPEVVCHAFLVHATGSAICWILVGMNVSGVYVAAIFCKLSTKFLTSLSLFKTIWPRLCLILIGANWGLFLNPKI